jgi:hypothetical protein
MSESPDPVGYGRPPRHTRFQKGQSGNPGGKPGPKKRLKHQFDAALSGALNDTRQALRDAKPTKVIEAVARKLAIDALEGRPSALRLLLSILDGEDGQTPDGTTGNDERLRKVLGDDAGSPRFIQTLPKRGYCFVAAVVEGAEARSAPSHRTSMPKAISAPASPAFSGLCCSRRTRTRQC